MVPLYMQPIPDLGKLSEAADESIFQTGMTLIARVGGQTWARGTRGVICARRVEEMLPSLGGVTLYVVLFDTGLQAELTALDLRRFFMVAMNPHPAVAGYEFKSTRDLHVDFHAGRFGSVFIPGKKAK